LIPALNDSVSAAGLGTQDQVRQQVMLLCPCHCSKCDHQQGTQSVISQYKQRIDLRSQCFTAGEAQSQTHATKQSPHPCCDRQTLYAVDVSREIARAICTATMCTQQVRDARRIDRGATSCLLYGRPRPVQEKQESEHSDVIKCRGAA